VIAIADSPVVLGVNFGTHDAAAALVCGATAVAAAEEERFTRDKQTKKFPAHAIAYCLGEAGLKARDITHVAFFADPRLQLLMPLANTAHAFPASLGSLGSDLAKYGGRRAALGDIRSWLGQGSGARIVPVRHHLAHAASAYLASPFPEATVVTLDGRGEYETACVFKGRNGRLARRHAVLYPHSAGYLYSMMTRYLGFRPQRDEYKVMGLAAHGGPSLLTRFRDLAAFDEATGQLRLNLSYFDHHRRPSGRRSLFSARLTETFGPPREPDAPIGDRHRDLAFAVQRLTEELVVRYVAFARRIAPSGSLCMAGGVALNAVANRAVIESGLFDEVFIQPAAGDAGTSLGAALQVAGKLTGRLARIRPGHHPAFLGPAYGQGEIDTAVKAGLPAGATVTVTSDPARSAARLLAADKVTGWFQGRCEFGPRALGNRSILANPGNRANTVRVNALIKRREEFRPLAPAVTEEAAGDYFELHPAGRAVYPYMLATAAVRPERAARIPAVVHADGSARLQAVSRREAPGFWSLVSAVGELTGVPVVLNTSFNGPDEPIACTPTDAVRAFAACGLDALVIGNTVIQRAARQ
jgi:carbamoyltransferase